MNHYDLLKIRLNLFDGGAAAGGEGGGAAAAAQTGDGAQQGETKAIPGNTRRGKNTGGAFQNVLFGKQSAAADGGTEHGAKPSDAGRDTNPQTTTTSNTLEDRRRAFQELVNGEYKDVYTEETQRIIDRRFRESKTLEQQASRNQPVIDMLMQRYKIADGDMGKLTAAIENNNAYWSEAAEEAGLTVEQYKEFQKLQRDNADLLDRQRRQQGEQAAQEQMQRWYGEAEQLKAVYPDFDLGTEAANAQFVSLLQKGVPIRHAYEVIHMDDIKASVAQSTARQTEKHVVDGIRAKGARPAENGTSSQSAFTVKDDPSRWSKQDRAEVARRVARGEIIKL